MCGTSVLRVRGQRFHGLVHCCTPWPLDLKHLELQASSTRTWPFCHISLPKTEPPLPSTRRHPSAGQGPPRAGARAHTRLTAAVEKGTHEHSCSQQHFHLSRGHGCSTSSQTDPLSPSWGKSGTLSCLCSLCH